MEYRVSEEVMQAIVNMVNAQPVGQAFELALALRQLVSTQEKERADELIAAEAEKRVVAAKDKPRVKNGDPAF